MKVFIGVLLALFSAVFFVNSDRSFLTEGEARELAVQMINENTQSQYGEVIPSLVSSIESVQTFDEDEGFLDLWVVKLEYEGKHYADVTLEKRGPYYRMGLTRDGHSLFEKDVELIVWEESNTK